ncbi:hypothetical protein [Nocardia camponoti]|uniref:hypothetical protein n=1 Tax=Nocardia camponoti TaxID=1616106 RepID=UPI00166D9048|nr:hypothetical protein [Nocardia camponoti]
MPAGPPPGGHSTVNSQIHNRSPAREMRTRDLDEAALVNPGVPSDEGAHVLLAHR